MKLAVLDFDSTVMDGETIDFLARETGQEAAVAKLTEAAMQGEIDFFGALQQRVKLLKGMKESRLNEICHNLPLMPGAKELISELKSRGYMVAIFSGGFRNATRHFKDIVGYDAEFSNTLHCKDGILTGLVGGEMMFDTSKGELLQRLQGLMGITPDNTLVCGDGANDLSMFKHASTRIAFCAKPVLREQATIIIEEKDLRNIIPELEA